MKIIHAIRRLDPATGGPPVVVLHIAIAQAAAGAEVHLICHEDPDTTPAVDAMLAEAPGSAGVTFHRIPRHGRCTELFAPALLRRFDQLVDSPDLTVAHLHGVWEPMLARVAAQARRRRAPYVVTPHGLLDPYSLSQSSLKKRLSMGLVQRRMLNAAAAIHALNEDEKQCIAPLKLTAPVAIVPNGVDLDTLDPLPEPGRFRTQHPRLGEAPFLLFLSRLHRKKGLDILVDAFDRYARAGGNMHLVVAGPDGGECDATLKLIQHRNLADRIHMVGPLYGPDKLAALRDAFAFVLSSRQEGFSIAITEALACSLPVIISDSSHFPEVAEVGAGRVLPLEAAAFAKAFNELEADPEAAAAMGRAGAQLVRDRYTWPKVAAAMIALYQSLLTQSP